MRLSLDFYPLMMKFSEEEAIKKAAAAGFDAIDYSFFWLDGDMYEKNLGDRYKEHAVYIRELLEKYGLSCNQAHAPFDFDGTKNKPDITDIRFKEIVRAIEAAAIMGADNIIVHALHPFNGMNVLDSNLVFYKALEPYAKKSGIKIAVENLFSGNRFKTSETMKEILVKLNSDSFSCCIDVGHATICDEDAPSFIKGVGAKYLKALHIHDNDGKSDMHTMPYMGIVDWQKVTASLKNIGYTGDFTFELFGFLTKTEPKLMDSALKFAHDTGRYLIDKIQSEI